MESVARSTSITTVSRPTYGHTEVSSVPLGHSSRAELPCSLLVFPPAPLMGDAKGAQSPSLLPLSAAGGRPEKERRPPLLEETHRGRRQQDMPPGFCYQCPLPALHRPASSQNASVLLIVSGTCREVICVSSHVPPTTALELGQGSCLHSEDEGTG